MKSHNINALIFCGEKGTGKSTYVIDKWPWNIVLQCDNPLNKLKTTSVLEYALLPIYQKQYADISEMVFALRTAVMEDRVVIIDSAELIDVEILKILINTLIPLKSATIIFTFDIVSNYLYQNLIFRQLIEWNLVLDDNVQKNFRAPQLVFEEFVTQNIHDISSNMLSELLEISNYNFNNLKRLIWLAKNKQNSFNQLSEKVITEYSYVMIEEKFSDIPRDMLDVLKKSSIIGEIFQRCILESQGGFYILGVRRYLEELETMNIFIHTYLSNGTYQFLSNQVHAGVLKCIEPKQRIAWEQILLNYYLDRLKSAEIGNEILEYLIQIKRLSISLNEERISYFANRKLLYYYTKLQDVEKMLDILNELIQYCKNNKNDMGLLNFFCFYKVRTNIKIGAFPEALQSIDSIKLHFPYTHSLYLLYYHALSLYGEGNVDEAYIETLSLIKQLEPTSAKAIENQPIYALSYSLMATLKHHFGIDDCGNKYYTLALNHSKNKLEEKNTYYKILKKCDMYFSYPFSKTMHIKSIAFFEEIGSEHDAAEVYINLATEMMFNEEKSFNEALGYFQKALKIFSNMPNWKLAYLKNNLAILYILYKNDFNEAASLLNEALLVGMSSFTYFTLYLNQCMCYLKLYGPESKQFLDIYAKFTEYHKIVSNRKNASQYDDIYKQFIDLIILEHSGSAVKACTNAKKILSLHNSSFFTPALRDLIRRTGDSSFKSKIYSDNINFYTNINNLRIFLAEFRFWE